MHMWTQNIECFYETCDGCVDVDKDVFIKYLSEIAYMSICHMICCIYAFCFANLNFGSFAIQYTVSTPHVCMITCLLYTSCMYQDVFDMIFLVFCLHKRGGVVSSQTYPFSHNHGSGKWPAKGDGKSHLPGLHFPLPMGERANIR